MKVLHILYSGLGGQGNEFFSAVAADKDRLFEYEALFHGIEDVRKEYVDRCNENGIRWQYVKKKRGLDLAYYKKIFSAIKVADPDIVRLHGSALILPAWHYKISRRKKIKIISAETQANHLKSRLENLWLALAIVMADHIVFLTSFYRDQVRQVFRLIYRETSTVVIPNGLDLSKFSPGCKETHETVVVGMQSRIVTIKDYDTLLLSIKEIKNRRPDIKVRLRIAGDGDNKSYLVDLASRLELSEAVEFTGMLDEEQLIDFIHSLDIYIHASFGETMSTAIMQAMACKLPIVASDVDGINNMLENGLTAILVPVKNPGRLADAIIQICDNPVLAQQLAENAYGYALANFSNKLMFNRYKKLYTGAEH